MRSRKISGKWNSCIWCFISLQVNLPVTSFRENWGKSHVNHMLAVYESSFALSRSGLDVSVMKIRGFGRWLPLLALGAVSLGLAGCEENANTYKFGEGPKAMRPVAPQTEAKMAELNMDKNAPILIRVYKEDSKFEIWKKNRSGNYALLTTYDICRWSGKLGPKVVEGDRQAPEGFYTITPGQMNPNSKYFLSFNTGYPNAYDRSLGRTGSNLMVHGACSSAGCYAMSDENIEQIYALARDAFSGGQREFQMQIYPFHLTGKNLARHWNDPNMPFWRMLKDGSDQFELTRQEPKVGVCDHKYVFGFTAAEGELDPSRACPDLKRPASLMAALAQKQRDDDAEYQVAVVDVKKQQADDAAHQLALAQVEEKARQEAAAEQARQLAAAEALKNAKPITLASFNPLSLFAPKTEADTDAEFAPLNAPPAGAKLPRPMPVATAAPSAQAPVQTAVMITPSQQQMPDQLAATLPEATGAIATNAPVMSTPNSNGPLIAPTTSDWMQRHGVVLPRPNPKTQVVASYPVQQPTETQPPADQQQQGFFGKIFGGWFKG